MNILPKLKKWLTKYLINKVIWTPQERMGVIKGAAKHLYECDDCRPLIKEHVKHCQECQEEIPRVVEFLSWLLLMDKEGSK